jgi:hypothetical protein
VPKTPAISLTSNGSFLYYGGKMVFCWKCDHPLVRVAAQNGAGFFWGCPKHGDPLPPPDCRCGEHREWHWDTGTPVPKCASCDLLPEIAKRHIMGGFSQ